MTTHTTANDIGPANQPATRGSTAYKTASVNGRQLAYLEAGSGQPVILVHGGITDLRVWDKQMAAFSENYRVIAYSRRYAWPNADIAAGEDDQMLPHVEDLADLIRKLNAAPAHLVGNSWGGFICLLTALRYPDLVRSVTVEEPPVMPLFVSIPPKPQEMLMLFLRRPRTGAALVKFMATGFVPSAAAMKKGDLQGGVRTFARAVLGADVYESLPAEVKQQMRDNALTHRAQFLGAGFPKFTAADARAIQTPILLVNGRRSPSFLLRLTDRLQELLPHTERVWISQASHLMHYENAPETNRAVLDFIARH